MSAFLTVLTVGLLAYMAYYIWITFFSVPKAAETERLRVTPSGSAKPVDTSAAALVSDKAVNADSLWHTTIRKRETIPVKKAPKKTAAKKAPAKKAPAKKAPKASAKRSVTKSATKSKTK